VTKIAFLSLILPILVIGCFPRTDYISSPTTFKGILQRGSTAGDSSNAAWMADDIRKVAFVRSGSADLTLALGERKHYIGLKLIVFNPTDSSLFVDADAITLLDQQRIELPRILPHEAANLVAQEVLPAPIYTPKYVARTTTTTTGQFLYPGTIQLNGQSNTIIEEDMATKAGNSFAQGFVEGFNKGVLEAADEIYRDGLVGIIAIPPHTGKRGRLYFSVPSTIPKIFIVKLGPDAEVGFTTR
jgi:hypothetical protein